MSVKSVLNQKPVSNKLLKQLKIDRLWFHAHPEVAFQEIQTARYICTRLDELNIPFVDGIAETGIVAIIKGKGESDHAIGLRADMDALPMKEENKFAHCSVSDNLMHGCGHDGHMAIMLGIAEMLSADRNFDGVVYIIFQPAEESGHAGAKLMIEEGLFSRFPMEKIFALHNWPDIPANVIGSINGPIMASSHYLSIKITGRGGHGAMPHQATPQMAIAAHIQLAINTYLAQQISAKKPVVVSLTQIQAGDAIAVLPETVLIKGACRLLDAQTTEVFYRDIPILIKGIAVSFGAKAEVDLHEIYPITENDSASTKIVRCAASRLGLTQMDENSGLASAMVSEDFSFMLQQCPGCYFFLGQGCENNCRALHQATYDYNDDTIETGVELFIEIVKMVLPLTTDHKGCKS